VRCYMLRKLLNLQRRAHVADPVAELVDWNLQVVLWILWTLAVVAVGYWNWRADAIAQRPLNLLGLVIHCALTGAIGLVVMTVIEMHLEPWRFVDADL
jgi:hypothetical protein